VATLLIEPEADQEMENAALRYEGSDLASASGSSTQSQPPSKRSAGSLRLAHPCLMSLRTCGLGALP